MVTNNKRRFLIPRDIAEQLGVNVSKVLAWIKSGELLAANVSNSDSRPRWRIKPEAFEAFLSARSNSGNIQASIVRSASSNQYV